MLNVDHQEADRAIYDRELEAFLPRRIFDAHVHLFDRSCLKPDATFPPRHCYQKFGGVFPQTDYDAWMKAWLPGREVYYNSFGHPEPTSDLDASAVYTGRISDHRRSFGMALVAPRDSAAAVVRRVESNRLIGLKPYLSFVEGKPAGEITIHDMLPAEQMKAADERGWAVTLHIPRSGRLADPVNQAQMVELCRRYPRARIIFAHIGRAYYLSSVTGFLDGLADCPNAYIDTAMINHEGVLEYAFRHFPPGRILFGSDPPFSLLRGKSVEINNQYAYLMGDDYAIGTVIFDRGRAVTFTTFFYEQLRGIKLAAERARLPRDAIEGILFNNANRLFLDVAGRNYTTRKDPIP